MYSRVSAKHNYGLWTLHWTDGLDYSWTEIWTGFLTNTPALTTISNSKLLVQSYVLLSQPPSSCSAVFDSAVFCQH